ncbi:hypothetical protein ASPCAL14104 [Aspergillus calidoustus]|uniref:BZIP domain-containing protein n=1 Tax=Aspergillus calidoustus TaxID=454130 RepID=A0A0U4ZNQ4_ASPCI|nr:hypothetical protein ASPCAL14104 [Aspergillus calidoustus]
MSQPLDLSNFDLEAYMSFFPTDSSCSDVEITTPPDSPFTARGPQLYPAAGDATMNSNSSSATSNPFRLLHDSMRAPSSAPSSIYQASAAEIQDSTNLLCESSLSATPAAQLPDPTSMTQSPSTLLSSAEDEQGEEASPKAKRRSQNRMAQQRFRERKEQEKAQLANRVKGLTSELGAAMQRIHELEAENERLVMELNLLRPWHRDVMNVLLAYPPGGAEPATTTVTNLGLGEIL